MNLKERNYAGDHVVVGNLEVLGDIKGSGITEIKRNVSLIQQQAELAFKQQNRYWEELSSDGIISPVEKQMLLKEMRSIQNSESAIIIQARSVGFETSALIQEYYIPIYNRLYSYIYNQLKLFDDMEKQTEIEDRAVFNQYFYDYYYAESFVYIGLTKGIIDAVNILVLDSLLDEGEEGQIGIYKGGMYQYVNGEWRNVNAENYKGALTSLPAEADNTFFLAADDFIAYEPFYVNDEPFYVNNELFCLTTYFRKGYIYYIQEGAWFVEADKRNWRYAAAFADVLNITGELPQIFQDAIDELQEEIDAISDNIHIPIYLGLSASDPSGAQEGDYFVYSGETTGTRTKSNIYRYTNDAWEELNPEESQNNMYYMQALEDVLSLNNASNGYFAALFANAFFANSATLYELSTKTLYLRTGGYIMSEKTHYTAETAGLKIDADGNIDANGNSHFGHKVAIGVPLSGNTDFDNYDVVIGGRCKIASDITSKNISLSGFNAGDIILRRIPTISIINGDQQYYSQICGTGVIRVKFFLGIQGQSWFYTYSNDLQIYEGESLEIKRYYESAMITSVDKIEFSINGRVFYTYDNLTAEYYCNSIFNIQICTDAPNGVLAYLGDRYRDDGYPSPAR